MIFRGWISIEPISIPARIAAAITRLTSTDGGNFRLLGIVVTMFRVWGMGSAVPLKGTHNPEKDLGRID